MHIKYEFYYFGKKLLITVRYDKIKCVANRSKPSPHSLLLCKLCNFIILASIITHCKDGVKVSAELQRQVEIFSD